MPLLRGEISFFSPSLPYGGFESSFLPSKLARRETLDPSGNGGVDDIPLRLLLRFPEGLYKGEDGVNALESLGQACLVAVVDHFPDDLGGETLSPGILDRRVSFLSFGWVVSRHFTATYVPA